MGFRVKSDLRNHQAIVQPRLYNHDCLMVTQITLTAPGQGLRIKPGGTRLVCFSVRLPVSLAGIEPVGFRVKSDLRNHQAIA